MNQKEFNTVDLIEVVHGEDYVKELQFGRQGDKELTEAIDRFLADKEAVRAAYDPTKGYVPLRLENVTLGQLMLVANQLTHQGLIAHLGQADDGTPIICLPAL